MEYFIIAIAAFLTSALTLFSGFGLGTMLLPVFAIFFHVDVAIALTAIVHLLNNLFKLILLGKHANKEAVLKFGIPAILSAFLGALLLLRLSEFSTLFSYELFSHELQVTLLKLVIGILMIVFATVELLPAYKELSFDKKYLPLGGVLSGFFGGLSGHQGALRSAFLVRSGLSKQAFIATGVVISILVDFSRLFIYTTRYISANLGSNWALLMTATLSAFLGAFLANLFLKKVTFRNVRILVSIMLFAIATALITGVV